ncbi:MAG: EamA family transporter [Anaerolineae bacterium]|nr:EamA family transporter [Anaerolineae bacterium]
MTLTHKINDTSTLTRGYIIALISAAILSTTAIFIRYLTQTYHIPPLVLAFWRDSFVILTLLPILSLRHPSILRVKRPHLLYLIGYGFVLAIFNTLWTLSVDLNGAAISTVLVYCSAAFTVLLGWWFFKESLNWGKLLAMLLSLGGCVLISGILTSTTSRASLAGISIGILSGLSYAAYSLMGRSAAQRGLNPWVTLFYTFGFATIFLICFNLLPENLLPGTATCIADYFWLGKSFAGWGILFLLAAGPTVAGFGLYNVSLSYLPSSVANLIVTLEPAFTAVSAYFLLGERLNELQIGGSLMILAGVISLRIQIPTSWRKQQISRQQHSQNGQY